MFKTCPGILSASTPLAHIPMRKGHICFACLVLEVSLVSSSSRCTASVTWCWGGGSWSSEWHRGRVAGAAVPRQHVLSRRWQHDCSPGGQISFGSCPFSEADPLSPAVRTHLQWNLLSLKIMQVNFGGSQSRILADTSKIINLRVKTLGRGPNSARTCNLRNAFHPMGLIHPVSLTRDLRE